MYIRFGDKIKALRKRDGRKQEDLAAALGVTNQAVSRWEADKGYPDMELLPAIANFFHVSIDELFGYSNDRETRLAAYIEKTDKMRNTANCKTDFEELESFLRKSLAEFPNEWKLQMRLAWVLESKAVEERVKGMEPQSLNEAIVLLEKARRKCDDDGWKDSLISQLASQYAEIGDDEKKERLAAESSPVFISREVLKANYTKDEEKRRRYSAEAILALIHSSVWAMDWNWGDSPDAFIAMAELYKALFGGKDYGMFNSDMCRLYLRAAYQYASRGEKRRTMECLDLAIQHGNSFRESWGKKQNKLSAPFLVKAADLPREYVIIDDCWISSAVSTFPDEIADAIRKDPKYASVFDN